MDSLEVRALVVQASELWPNYRFPDNADALARRVETWLGILSDVPATFALAALRSFAHNDFAPPPGKIRNVALDLMREASGESLVPDVDAACAEFFDAMARYGWPRPPGTSWDWSHPAIGETVRALGGWLECCSDENRPALRAHFERLYRSASERVERQRRPVAPAIGRALVTPLTQPRQGELT